MNIEQQLIDKIAIKTSVIGIVGLGYVGLPLMLRYVEEGYKVLLGINIDQSKVDNLNDGISYIEHIASEGIQSAIQKGLFSATTDFSQATNADSLILCVPTI